jgi:hypothetical protein
MGNGVGLSPKDPNKYLGPNVFLNIVVTRNREPTSADYRQPETGKLYSNCTIWQVGKNPTTGTEGDLWILTKIVGNVAFWVQISVTPGSSGIDSITTDDGAPPVVPDINGNVNIISGPGTKVTGQGPGNSVTVSTIGGGLDWSVITDATQNISVQNGYFANRGAGVTFTLPATAEVGDMFALSAIDAGGWTLAQNAAQVIRMGNQVTTTGVGGSLASTANGDTIRIVCSVQDTNFQVISSMGNITVV